MESFPHIYQEERPWGSFERFTLNEISSVKILRVAPGKRFSLQKHAKRSEFWKVIQGGGSARVGDTEHPLVDGDEIQIPVGALHRLTAGPSGIAVLEICMGEFDESDIVRTEDDFGRIPETPPAA
jgi:mannose-6-phosphate isomerase-like protein (cupin superfamily)